MSHTCTSLVVHCMDFRFEKALFDYLDAQHFLGDADIVGWAGAGKAFLDPETQSFALKQVELSHKLHGMCNIHVIQHRDCGGYGGSKIFENRDAEFAFHVDEVKKIRALIQQKFPDVSFTVTGYFAEMSEDGTSISFKQL